MQQYFINRIMISLLSFELFRLTSPYYMKNTSRKNTSNMPMPPTLHIPMCETHQHNQQYINTKNAMIIKRLFCINSDAEADADNTKRKYLLQNPTYKRQGIFPVSLENSNAITMTKNLTQSRRETRTGYNDVPFDDDEVSVEKLDKLFDIQKILLKLENPAISLEEKIQLLELADDIPKTATIKSAQMWNSWMK